MARRLLMAVLASAAVVGGGIGALEPPLDAAGQSTVPAYDHIFVIVEENHSFSDVIGNPAAPNLNHLATTFGLSTDYFGVSHPSEPNYVALLGGSTFGVNSDDAYYTQTVNRPDLMSQLDTAGITWKAYLQALPHPNYQGICYPANCNGAPDKDPLYVSKHDAIQNYSTSRTTADWNRQVPIAQLQSDVASSSVPRFGYIIPTECSDAHGDPPYCIDGGNVFGGTSFDPQDQRLVAQGDQYLGNIVQSLTHASFWAKSNNAIDIVYDEGDDNQGCCDAGTTNPNGTGGGKVANIVVTSHGPRGVTDSTPSNHYSLLSTIQSSFGLGCLAHTCDTANVKPLSKLFAVTGSHAIATKTITPPTIPTPTPTPTETPTHTSLTPSGGGFTVQKAAALGLGDNSLGAVSVTSATDVWAVGDFLPDDPSSNQDATLSLAEHWDGTRWAVTPTPNAGPNFTTLASVTGNATHAWAAGTALNSAYKDAALIETWNGSEWSLTAVPQPGSQRNQLFSISAVSPSDVWAVGDQQGSSGVFETLVEHFDGTSWSDVPAPNPGSTGNLLWGVSAAAGDVWAVGEQMGSGGFDEALAEHWTASSGWTVVPSSPSAAAKGSTMLFSVTHAGGGVYAAGQTEGATNGATALVEKLSPGGAVSEALPAVRSRWAELWGISASADHVYAVGTLVNATTSSNAVIVMRRDSDGWHLVGAPNPGDPAGGSNILGGAGSSGTVTVTAGTYDIGGNNLPLVEVNPDS